MTKRRNKKRTLIASILSLILCLSMLIGTTMAWFTDVVYNKGNRIQMGTFDVDLEMYKDAAGSEDGYVSIADSTGDIFSEATGNVTIWEPGKTQIVFLKVKNKGDLALNYNFIIDVSDSNLNDSVHPEKVLEYAVIEGWTAQAFASSNITEWKTIKGDNLAGYPVRTAPVKTGITTVIENGGVQAGQDDYFALAVHMDEEAGNEYMNQAITIDVQLVAKQKSEENDSFGTLYDERATYSDEIWKEDKYISKFKHSFELGESDWPAKNESGVAEIKTDGGQDGERYVYLSGGTAKPPEARKGGVMNGQITPGKEYKLTAWVKSIDGGLPQLRIDFYSTTNKYVDWTGNIKFSEVEPGGWVQISYNFIAPETLAAEDGSQTGRMTVFLQKASTTGTLYWDNIEILEKVVEKVPETFVEKEAAKFRAMLEAEAAVSQLVSNAQNDDPKYVVKTPIGPELITDGGFDIDTLNVEGTSAWFAMANSASSGEVIMDGEDNQVLKITDKGYHWPWYYQQFGGIAGGAEYQISYKYKLLDEETIPYIKIETYQDPGIPGVGAAPLDQIDVVPENMEFISDGEWHTVTMRTRVGESVSFMRIIPRIYDGQGSLLFDDISVKMTATAEMMTLDTGHKFFYEDQLSETVNFTVSVDTICYPEYAKAKVDFQVFDGETLIWDNKQVELNNGTLTVPFELSNLYKKAVPYCVKATLYNEDGSLRYEVTDTIFVYPRPEYYSADGVYQAEGEEPFYPIFGYHANKEHFSKLAESGINTIQAGSVDFGPEEILEELDELERLGMKGYLVTYFKLYPTGAERNIERSIAVLTNEEIINHPALYGYLVMDEPFLDRTNRGGMQLDTVPMILENSYRLIREYDTKHPIMMVECFENYYKETAKYVDVLLVDPYQPAKSGLVYSKTESALQATNGRPVQTILETCRHDTIGRFLTGADTRNNIYQALIAGSTGVGFFSISDSEKDENGKYTIPIWEGGDVKGETWEGILTFSNTVEKELAFSHFIDNESPVYKTDMNSSKGYMYYSWIVGSDVYMVVMGMQNYGESITTDIDLSTEELTIGDFSAEVISGAESDTFNGNGSLKVTVSGVDTVLYKITLQ